MPNKKAGQRPASSASVNRLRTVAPNTTPNGKDNMNGGASAIPNPEAARLALQSLLASVPPELRAKIQSDYDRAITQALSEGQPLEKFLPALRFISAAEISTKEFKPLTWVIPDYLPIGLTILAGRPKVGKSWLALQVCRNISAGGKIFGRDVERGRALYLSLEDYERRLKDRMIKQRWPANPKGIDYMLPDAFRDQIQRLNGGGGARLAKVIAEKGYRFVVIDTLSRALKGDQKDESDMTEALAPLQETALRLEISVLVVDHHKKPMTAADPNPVDDILGSTAKGAVADAIWGLYAEQGKAGAKLCITGRDVEQITLKIIRDDFMCWQSEGEAYAIDRTEQRDRIIEAIKMLGRCQLATIAKTVGEDEGNTFRRLQDMANAGMIKRIEDKKHAKVFYDLPESPDQLQL
jgi:hypothetical protein